MKSCRLDDREIVVRLPRGAESSLHSIQPAVHPPSNPGTRTVSQSINRSGCEDDQSSPPNSEVKNVWSYTSNSTQSSIWCLIKQGNNCRTLYITRTVSSEADWGLVVRIPTVVLVVHKSKQAGNCWHWLLFHVGNISRHMQDINIHPFKRVFLRLFGLINSTFYYGLSQQLTCFAISLCTVPVA